MDELGARTPNLLVRTHVRHWTWRRARTESKAAYQTVYAQTGSSQWAQSKASQAWRQVLSDRAWLADHLGDAVSPWALWWVARHGAGRPVSTDYRQLLVVAGDTPLRSSLVGTQRDLHDGVAFAASVAGALVAPLACSVPQLRGALLDGAAPGLTTAQRELAEQLVPHRPVALSELLALAMAVTG